jgi:hypothetical protein
MLGGGAGSVGPVRGCPDDSDDLGAGPVPARDGLLRVSFLTGLPG